MSVAATLSRAVATRPSRRRLWLLWYCGVAIFPIAGAFVSPDPNPFPHLGDYGRGIGVWSAWAAGFAFMAYAMFRLRREPVRVLVTAQLTAGLAFVMTHAMPSIDTYAYLGYGDEFLHRANPWQSGSVAAYDGITQAFTAVWGPSPPSCRYGPAFVLLEAALIRLLDGSSVGALVVAQRLLSLGAAAGITALVRGPNARFWALNPFVAYYYVLEAHNDVLFLLALACAARIRRPILQGALVGFAGAIKIVALAALLRTKPRSAALSIASAALVLFALYEIEPLALGGDGLRTQIGIIGNSIASLIYQVAVKTFGPHVDVNTVEVSYACALVAVAFFIRWSKRDAAAYLILLSIAALPTFWPWYLGWALFAGITSSYRSTLRFVVVLCLCSFVTDLPYLGVFVYNTQVTWLFLFVSLALLVAYRIVPCAFALPGRKGTIFWYVQRLTLRLTHVG